MNVPRLRRLAASPNVDLHAALIAGDPPQEVVALLDLLAALLRPTSRERVTTPADVAALLMVEMGHFPQEQLRVVCLDTKNQVRAIQTVYQGSVNSAPVRVAEVFREPIRRNSAAIILAHNHPSGLV